MRGHIRALVVYKNSKNAESCEVIGGFEIFRCHVVPFERALDDRGRDLIVDYPARRRWRRRRRIRAAVARARALSAAVRSSASAASIVFEYSAIDGDRRARLFGDNCFAER